MPLMALAQRLCLATCFFLPPMALASSCSSALLVYGLEDFYPDLMGEYTARANDSTSTGQPTYEKSLRGALVLLQYHSVSRYWHFILDTNSTDTLIWSNNSDLCPDDASAWYVRRNGTDEAVNLGVTPFSYDNILEKAVVVASSAGGDDIMRIGAVLSIDCCSTYSRLGHTLKDAYADFVEWVNNVHGGVEVDGSKRQLELIILSDDSDEMKLREATWRLITSGIRYLLGPAGSLLSDVSAAVVQAFGGTAVVLLPAAPEASSQNSSTSVVVSTLPQVTHQLSNVIPHLASRGVASLLAVHSEQPPGTEFARMASHACASLPQLAVDGNMSLASFSFNGTMTVALLSALQAASEAAVVVCVDVPLCAELLSALEDEEIDLDAVVLATACSWASANVHGNRGYATTGAVSWPQGTFTDLPHLSSNGALGEKTLYISSAWFAALRLVSAIETGVINSTLLEHWVEGSATWSLGQYNYKGSLEVIELEDLWFPMPNWYRRPCFDADSIVNEGFGEEANCTLCSIQQVRIWIQDAWMGHDGWVCVPCPVPNEFLTGTGQMLNVLISRTCIPCPAGTFLDVAGLPLLANGSGDALGSRCLPCLPGHFTSTVLQTACEPCGIGFDAPSHSSVQCEPCPPGHIASQNGTATCAVCPLGFEPDASAGACTGCPAGRFSSVESGSCMDCPQGRFQDTIGNSDCILCPAGSRCDAPGLSVLSNLKNWWARMPPNCSDDCFESIHKEWFPCNLQSTVCQVNEECAAGGTGVLCQVCLPDYTWVNGECKSCPDWTANLMVSLSAGLVLGFGIVALTSISIGAAGTPKSITSALLKLMLNYVTTMGYMSEVLMLVLDSRGEAQIRQDPSSGVRSTEQPLRIMTMIIGTAVQQLHSVWSLDCLWQPTLDDGSKEAIDTVAQATFSEFPEVSQGSERLLEFHEQIQFRSSIFWICLTPGMVLTLLFLMTPLLLFHMRRKKRHYKSAGEFYMKLARPKTRERAMRRLTPAKVEEYVRIEQYRYLGIWRVVGLMHYSLGRCTFWKKFIQDALPLFIIVIFVLYPLVLRALLDPLRCVKPTDEVDGNRWSKSLDVECGYDEPIFWSTVVLSFFWGFCLPAASGIAIYVKYEDFHNPRLQRTWGFLTGGYELDRCYWECIILVRKTFGVLVSSVQMSLGTRIILMVVLAGIFLFLHVRYQPFDNRYNELLDRIEMLHLLAWNIFALALVGLYMLDGSHDAIELVIVIGLMCLHIAFGVMIFTRIAQSYIYAFADSYTKGIIAQDVVSLISHGTVRPSYQDLERLVKKTSRMGALIIRKYGGRQDSLPYIALRQDGFKPPKATIFGNRGAQCRLPIDATDELMRAVMPQGTRAPDRQAMKYLLNILFDALEYCVVEQEQDVFSGTLLEFVLRVGFTFGVDGNLRLQDPDSMMIIGGNNGQSTSAQVGFSLARFWRRGVFVASSAVQPELVDSMGIIGATGAVPTTPQQSSDAPRPAEMGRRGSSDRGRERRGSQDRRASLDIDPTQGLIVKTPEVSSDKHAASVALGMKLLAKSKRRKGEEIVQVKRMERLERVHSYVQNMFESRNYLQGVTLEDLQLNLTAKLHRTSKEELQVWLDAFEETWRDRRHGLESEHYLEGIGHDAHGNSVAELRNPIRLSDAATMVVEEDFHPEFLLQDLSMSTDVTKPEESKKRKKSRSKSKGSSRRHEKHERQEAELNALLGEDSAAASSFWADPSAGSTTLMAPRNEDDDDVDDDVPLTAIGRQWIHIVICAMSQDSLERSHMASLRAVEVVKEKFDKHSMRRKEYEHQVMKVYEKKAGLKKQNGDTELELTSKLAKLRQQLADVQVQRTRQMLMPENPEEWRLYDI